MYKALLDKFKLKKLKNFTDIQLKKKTSVTTKNKIGQTTN